MWKEGEKLCSYEWESGGNFRLGRDNGKFGIEGDHLWHSNVVWDTSNLSFILIDSHNNNFGGKVYR
jgi:hypothetical protein